MILSKFQKLSKGSTVQIQSVLEHFKDPEFGSSCFIYLSHTDKKYDLHIEKIAMMAINFLKLALTTLVALVWLDYSDRWREMIHAITANLDKWQEILMQVVKTKKYFLRYKNKIWLSR